MSQAKQTFENDTDHAWGDFEMLPVGPTFENNADHVSAMSSLVCSYSENDTIHYKSRRTQKYTQTTRWRCPCDATPTKRAFCMLRKCADLQP